MDGGVRSGWDQVSVGCQAGAGFEAHIGTAAAVHIHAPVTIWGYGLLYEVFPTNRGYGTILQNAAVPLENFGFFRIPKPCRNIPEVSVLYHLYYSSIMYTRYIPSFFLSSLLLSSSLVGGFTLRSRGHRCRRIQNRVQFSIPIARRFSANVANSCSRAFRSSIFYARKIPTSMCTR